MINWKSGDGDEKVSVFSHVFKGGKIGTIKE